MLDWSLSCYNILKVLVKSLYVHTYGEMVDTLIGKGSSGSGMVVIQDVHKVVKFERHSNRRSGVNPRYCIHLRGL